MKIWQFGLVFLGWVGLAIFGGWMAFVPVRWATQNPHAGVEETRQRFKIRMANLPASEMRQHIAQIEGEEVEVPEFHLGDWALREMKFRGVVVFVVWMAAGFFLRWLVGQVMRGKMDLEDD